MLEAVKRATKETKPVSRTGQRRKRVEKSSDDTETDDAATQQSTVSTSKSLTTCAAAAGSRRKAPKPNRQRCKEFRERRKGHVAEMDERVAALRHEVAELELRKSIYSSKAMFQRHHAHGSLEKLVREYYSLFRNGISISVDRSHASCEPNAVTKAQTQWAFLQRVVDPETVYGDHKGPAGAIAQWGYYTAAYASFVGQVNRVHLAGSEDDPILYCYTTYHVVLSRATVKYLFPHVLHNEPLVQRLIGLYVPCPVVGIYRFSSSGQICSENANIELAEALLAAGCRVADVTEMMQGFVISEDGVVPDRLQSDDHKFMEEIGIALQEETRTPSSTTTTSTTRACTSPEREEAVVSAKEKLRISFLLDQDDREEEDEEKENVTSNSS